VALNPKVLDTTGKQSGLTPLHYSLILSPPPTIKVIEFLIGDATLTTSKIGRTPLHGACHRKLSDEVIELLIRRSPHLSSRFIRKGKVLCILLLSKHCRLTDSNFWCNLARVPLAKETNWETHHFIAFPNYQTLKGVEQQHRNPLKRLLHCRSIRTKSSNCLSNTGLMT